MVGVVYYFSGTGNSFAIARDIATRLDASLVSIAALLRAGDGWSATENGPIGMVFPDYHSDLPLIVRRFIDTVGNWSDRYVFGLCTYGGRGPGPTINHLKTLLESRGGTLACGFAVRMPYNYIVPSLSFRDRQLEVRLNAPSEHEQAMLFEAWRARCHTIVEAVRTRRTGSYETSALIISHLITVLRLKNTLGKGLWLKFAGYRGKYPDTFRKSITLMDHGFSADERCISCGTCVRVCPVANISLDDEVSKPVWHHRCEQCFACLQWCPCAAIQFGPYTATDRRYHHPNVRASDLALR